MRVKDTNNNDPNFEQRDDVSIKESSQDTEYKTGYIKTQIVHRQAPLPPSSSEHPINNNRIVYESRQDGADELNANDTLPIVMSTHKKDQDGH